jgi:SAM-dependent methyltransferase
MTADIGAFYDEFSNHFVEDIVMDNERIGHQLAFFARAIPAGAESVLVLGFGSGQGAHFIAERVAKGARVLGLDISPENVRFAGALYAHPRVEYRRLDVTTERLDGRFDVIALPDVYEHIPQEARPGLHAQFDRLLSDQGRILLTIPSPGYQKHLYARGTGLQPVDEIVSVEDLLALARDVSGELSYFSLLSVWQTNDYAHAVVERGAGRVGEIGAEDMLPIKGWPRRSVWARGRDFLDHRLGWTRLRQGWRRRHLLKRLAARGGAVGGRV